MKVWKEYISPTIILMVISLIVTLALSGTYHVTKPIIIAITKANADAAREEVLPSGSGNFSPVNTELLDGITEVYSADNQTGFVITSVDKGFGGKITVMAGINVKGRIQGIKILEHSETPGLGTKAMTDKHLSQYLDQSKITITEEPDAAEIDAITGATISSNAVFRAVEQALNQYRELGGAADE